MERLELKEAQPTAHQADPAMQATPRIFGVTAIASIATIRGGMNASTHPYMYKSRKAFTGAEMTDWNDVSVWLAGAIPFRERRERTESDVKELSVKSARSATVSGGLLSSVEGGGV